MRVIGIGNPYRSDDGVGVRVAERIRARAPDVDVRIVGGDAAALIDAWTGAEHAIVIDAMRSGAAVGTVRRFDPTAGPLSAPAFASSTHALGLAQAIEIARALNRLPPRLDVYGIEGRRFAAGTVLSAEVEAAVEDVVRRVLADVEAWDRTARRPG